MAATTNDAFNALFEGTPCTGEFAPYTDYGSEEDSLMFFFRPDGYVAKRLNSRVTVYVSTEDNELVGCQIKGIRHVVEDIGEFDVNISHGKISLTLVFAAMRNDFLMIDGDGRVAFKALGKAARDSQLNLEFA